MNLWSTLSGSDRRCLCLVGVFRCLTGGCASGHPVARRQRPQHFLRSRHGTYTGIHSAGNRGHFRGVFSVVIVNVFASWCVPCRAEHGVLTQMVEKDGLTLFGINYKDKPEDATKWLAELGNPYERIGSDLSGRVGIEWGLSGCSDMSAPSWAKRRFPHSGKH